MPTIEEDKPAKPRQRSRKAEQRARKAEQKAAAKSDSDAIDAGVVPAEAALAEAAPDEAAPDEAAPMEAVPLAIAVESFPEAALSGEVLPPEIRAHAPQTAGAQAIALAYGEYAQNSWAASRFLVDRLIAARSFDEAVDIQREFAKQSYVNFFAQSQKIWELYGEWVQQFFRPFDKFVATGRDQGSHTLH
jgi:hypothetical protein